MGRVTTFIVLCLPPLAVGALIGAWCGWALCEGRRRPTRAIDLSGDLRRAVERRHQHQPGDRQ